MKSKNQIKLFLLGIFIQFITNPTSAQIIWHNESLTTATNNNSATQTVDRPTGTLNGNMVVVILHFWQKPSFVAHSLEQTTWVLTSPDGKTLNCQGKNDTYIEFDFADSNNHFTPCGYTTQL